MIIDSKKSAINRHALHSKRLVSDCPSVLSPFCSICCLNNSQVSSMGSCTSRNDSESDVKSGGSAERLGYEFQKQLPKGTRKFREMKLVPLPTKSGILSHLNDPTVDDTWRCLAQPEFASVDQITRNLFLTSVSGLNKEDVKQHDIGFIVNATTIMPVFQEFQHQTLRVPVDDDRGADIYPYLGMISGLFC